MSEKSSQTVDWRMLPDASLPAFDFENPEAPVSDSCRGYSLPEPSFVLHQNHFEQASYGGIVFLHHKGLSLAVKYGIDVTTEEAMTMWAMRKYMPMIEGRRPIPIVYGWRRHDGVVYIYMERIEGVKLDQRWPFLSVEDKTLICTQVGQLVEVMRSLKQADNDIFIGSITRGPILDNQVFVDRRTTLPGPFLSFMSFYAFLDSISKELNPKMADRMHYIEKEASDQVSSGRPGRVVFCHGDLHRHNIIVPEHGPPKLQALLDWENSGWYPDYWEYFKTFLSNHEWEDDWCQTFTQLFLREKYLREFQCLFRYAEKIGVA